MTNDRIVVVAGATGRQGGAVVRHLLAAGWRVRALTRKPGSRSARQLVADGAEVLAADMSDPASLEPALHGAYGVHSVQNPMTAGLDGEIEQGKNIADAAAAAEIRHLVYGSSGIGSPTGVAFWDTKLAIEDHLRELGLPLTVLRPTAFMELMTARDFFPPVTVWQVMPKLVGPDRPIPWLCVDDLGAIVAAAFTDPDRFVGLDIKPAADLRSINECRDIWRRVTGRLPRRIPMPTPIFERFVSTDLTAMWRWLHTNTVGASETETRRILPGALTVQEFLSRARGR